MTDVAITETNIVDAVEYYWEYRKPQADEREDMKQA